MMRNRELMIYRGFPDHRDGLLHRMALLMDAFEMGEGHSRERFYGCIHSLLELAGTYGFHGFVTNKLEDLINQGVKFDRVFAIGPLLMMKFACKLTEKYSSPTTVSMNPIMIDGTGMCGCCRLTVDGEVKFACVDGPDFDGHKVDFDEVIARNATYLEQEIKARDNHICRLGGGAMNG